MSKVQCKVCGDIGYTASPECLVCECGGKFKVIPEDNEKEGTVLDEEALRLFDASDLIK